MAEEKKFYSNFNSVLVARGVLTAEQLEEAVQEAGRTPLDRYLMESGKVDSGKLLLAEAEYVGHEPLQLPKNFATPLALVDLATPDFWKRNKALPLQKCGDALVVAFGDPFDMMAPENVARTVKLEVLPLVALEKEVADALARAEQQRNSQNPALAMENVMHSPETELELSKGSDAEESLDQSIQSADEAPVIRMVNMMLVEALRTGASDIHFEAMEKTSRLRYRIDGALIERPAPPKALHNAIVSRIKIMSDLDIAERRVPQDGRFKVKAMGKEVDIRVSILPTIHGEKVVMRTLDKTNLAPSLAALGLDDRLGQDDDALLLPPGPQPAGRQHRHRRGPGRVPAPGRQPGRREPAGRPHVRLGSALGAAPGPGHLPRRRDPRRRDRRHRRQGRPHGPPGVLDAAH